MTYKYRYFINQIKRKQELFSSDVILSEHVIIQGLKFLKSECIQRMLNDLDQLFSSQFWVCGISRHNKRNVKVLKYDLGYLLEKISHFGRQTELIERNNTIDLLIRLFLREFLVLINKFQSVARHIWRLRR